MGLLVRSQILVLHLGSKNLKISCFFCLLSCPALKRASTCLSYFFSYTYYNAFLFRNWFRERGCVLLRFVNLVGQFVFELNYFGANSVFGIVHNFSFDFGFILGMWGIFNHFEKYVMLVLLYAIYLLQIKILVYLLHCIIDLLLKFVHWFKSALIDLLKLAKLTLIQS